MDEIINSISFFQPKLIRVMGKQGIGKSLLEYLKLNCFENGINNVVTSTIDKKNFSSIKLFESSGFRIDQRKKGYGAKLSLKR